MATIKLDAQLRSETGKGAARTMRRAGLVPAVIYGHGEETRACAVSTKELEKLVSSGSHESTLIELALDDGKTRSVLIREVQIHPYRPQVLHVDFLAVRKGEKVKLDVPVRLTGIAPGVKEGGIMEHLRHEVEVRCLPAKIPEYLELDVSGMGMGDAVTVEDLVVPEGVEVLSDATATIAAVVPPAVLKVAEPEEEELVEVAEEEAEPEVIGRGKPAEEEESSQEEK
jgi:large subunit ribosomal protein L25